ncbi:MAG: hypothetical protein JKY19_03990 [Alcanivoracaceae bacterium]|nr:hypothetical protein [Alcanivoracaceae bacterium]
MKKLLFITLFSTGVYASDLIYLNGFENTGLVSGTITGLNATGLQLDMTSLSLSQNLLLDQNGSFVFSLQIPIGDNWEVSITTLPDNPIQQSCTINNQSGVMPATGADNLAVVCNNISWVWDEMDWDEGGWQ